MKQDNLILNKTLDFAIRIVNMYKYLVDAKKEYVMSKQLLRSGTSIGANIRESQSAESNTYFIHKFSISLKEINETMYWLELLYKTEFISQEQYESVNNDVCEIRKIISSIIISAKKK